MPIHPSGAQRTGVAADWWGQDTCWVSLLHPRPSLPDLLHFRIGAGRAGSNPQGFARHSGTSARRPGHIGFPSRVPFPSLPPVVSAKRPLADISSLSPDRGFSIRVRLGLQLPKGGQGLLAPLGFTACAVPRLPWALRTADWPGPRAQNVLANRK